MITVYTKYNCPQCDITKNVLDNEGIVYKAINVEDDAEALDYIKNTLGFSATPVIVAEGHEPFSGFRPEILLMLK